MDLIADRGRRVTVEELNTTRLLAHARKQAVQRKLDDMLIVDVDAHHYESENFREFLPYMENDVLRQLAIQGIAKGGRGAITVQNVGYQDMGGRVTRYPLRSSEKTEEKGHLRDVQLGYRWMDAMSVDYSCLFPTGMLSIGMHPQKEMEARAVLGLQSLAHREGAAGIRSPLLFDAVPAVQRCRRGAAPRRDVRRPQARRRLHGDDRAPERRAREPVHEGLPRHRGARPGAVVPLRPELVRADLQDLQPLPVGACAGLQLVQHPALHQLGDQRPGRALPEAAGGLDRVRPGLDPVPDAEARPRIHAAPVRGAAAQEEAVRLHARHVLLDAADGDPGHGARWSARSA